MMNKKEIGNQLEEIVVSYIKPFDPYCRRTRASGASNDIGDVSNNYFYIECKVRNTENLIISKKTWEHLTNQIPIASTKIPLLIQKNKKDKIFVTMEIDDWNGLIEKLHKNNLL